MTSTSRHKWDEDTIKRIAGQDMPNGCGQTIRTCTICGLVRITMHPPDGQCWIEFKKGDLQVALSTTPPCTSREPVEVKPA